MKAPVWLKPGIWGGVVGAVVITIVGFSQMGWTTSGAANRMASERAEFAVVTALVPFCVANAERDPDGAKLAKIKAEQSSYTRGELVSAAGWATMPGETSPERGLVHACAEKLLGSKA